MQVQTQTQTTSPRSLQVKDVQEKSFLQALLFEIKLAFFTISFVLFCVLAIAGAWYLSRVFTNDSYKAVVFFLDIITVSNIAGKYFIWVIKS